jgi:ATP-dependent exoDNAse (exonuclease V) beta subunit
VRRSATDYRTPSSRAARLVGTDLERCIFCRGTEITREGRRYKKLETVQLWYCHTCDRVFTPQRAKGKTYPLKIILESLMLYYRGDTRTHVAKRIKERFGIAIPPRTLSTWLAEYRELTTYARLRNAQTTRYRPDRIIRAVRMHHQQVYEYRFHQAKLESTLSMPKQQHLQPIQNYLLEIADTCPHQLFRTDMRASQGKTSYNLDAVEIKSNRNHACRVADLVLQAVTNNKRRHDEIQRFMLATDSVTIAVEVPIFLQASELAQLKSTTGFEIPIDTDGTITGHIDFLQIRNGAIHIVDYKPGAKSEKPIPQLMTYALALSRRTGLRLFDFVCSWFDEHNYYQFYPLHVVHRRQRPILGKSPTAL